jgi:hypothetical protein
VKAVAAQAESKNIFIKFFIFYRMFIV